MKEQFSLHDELLDFSSRLDSEGYNVKAYRKHTRTHHHQKLLHSTEVLTELARIDLSQHTQGATNIDSDRRLAATAAVRRRPRAAEKEFPGFTKTARTKHNSVLEERRVLESPQDRTIVNSKSPETHLQPPVLKHGSFSQQQREFAKGGLKNKHLENWLNQILLEYCHEEKFDSTIEHPALKKYGIDRNSLLSKGINPRNLERIYRSLFVYSMGFNTLLREIGTKNMNLRKTFWKVYAILLEYCSQGDFQTMIGEIERDKARKMELLRGEIERRQELIDNNEDIHQEKNAKIFKELKLLRDQNQDLQNDKNVLMEDFKQAEQAFNEEVSLRLKFQNKINQIHGVHRELAIKHSKLYDDLQARTAEAATLRDKLSKLTDTHTLFRTDNDFLKRELAGLREEREITCGQLEELRKKCSAHDMLEVEWRHRREEHAVALREREKRVEQVKAELRNAELMLAMKAQSQQQLQAEYSRALSENRQLAASLQKELEQINILMVEKKNFNDSHSRIYAQLEVTGQQLSQKAQQIQFQRQQIEVLTEEVRSKSIQIQILVAKTQQQQLDMRDLFTKIAQMKQIKTLIEEELTQARTREDYYRNFYAEKQKTMETLAMKAEEDERTIAEFNILRKTLESKVTLLGQKLQAEEQSGKKKQEKLREQVKILTQQKKSLQLQLQSKAGEVQRATQLYQQTFNKLKDQLFQRNDLELRYNQSLSVVQSQTDHIKKLSIRISELTERNEELQRKMKAAEFVLENREKAFQSELQAQSATISHLKEIIRQHKFYVHPMRLEDLQSQIMRALEKNQKDRAAAEEERKSINLPALNARIKHLQAELFEAGIVHQEELARKERELQAERQRVRELEESYEQAIVQETPEASPKVNNFKQKERRYLQIIREKSTQVQDLLRQVQSMHDQNNQLITRVSDLETYSKQQDSKLEAFQSQYSQLESQRHALTLEKTSVFKEKERLLAHLAEQEGSRLLQNEENRTGMLGVPSSFRQTHSRQKSSRMENSSRQGESREKVVQPGWRNDFTKKVKNAYNYYKK